MSKKFVPDGFNVPTTFAGPGFHLEPLAPEHNERDHKAWMESLEHIRSTPGMEGRKWPVPMTLEQNMSDMEMHFREFQERGSFTYSILDEDTVIGCVYIYPDRDGEVDADVRSWVSADRAEMDKVVWSALSEWLRDSWPFASFRYATR